MNKLEARYAEHLETKRRLGEILWFSYEAIKLILAERTTYLPDFIVLSADDSIEIHEVKGHWEQAARVKIKVAAEKFPFKFKAITWERKQWVYEEF